MHDALSEGFDQQAAKAASLLRALSHEHRLLVLCHLVANGELSAGQLVDRIGTSQSALSQHLAKLRDQGLVATRKEAQNVFYRVGDPRAERVLGVLQDIFCPELSRQSDSRRTEGDPE